MNVDIAKDEEDAKVASWKMRGGCAVGMDY